MTLYNNIEDLIGNTPVIELKNILNKKTSNSKIFAKLEFFNPFGSIKDRVCKNIIDSLITMNKINFDSTLIVPTSGNLGIAFASICALRKLKLIIVMPKEESIYKEKLFNLYHCKIVYSEPTLGMEGSIIKANQLHSEIKNSCLINQFELIENKTSHHMTIKEILDLGIKIDYIVCGIGSGGTIGGISEYINNNQININVVGVEPYSSPFLTKGYKGNHLIKGIGAGFKPKILELNNIHKIILVKDEEAVNRVKEVAYKEGIGIGLSSGAILEAAIKVAKEENNKNIICIFPDSISKYLTIL